MMHMHSPVRGSLHARVTARTVKGPSLCSHSPLLKHGRAACVRVAAASISATNFVNQAEQQEPRRNWSIKEFLDWWVVKSPKAPDDPPLSGSPKHSQLLRVGGKLFSLISNDTGLLFCAILFMVGAAVSELAIPHFATQCIFAAATAGAGVESYSGTLRLVTAIILAYGTASALRGFCFSLLNNRMSKRLRSQLFASLVRREMSFFDTNEVGGITSRLQSDCQAMTKCISTNLNVACRNLLQAIGGAIYLSLTSPVLCGATLGVCALLASITLAYGQYARHNQRVVQDTLAASSQVAEEVLSLTRVVRAFGTEAQEQARYVGWLQRLYEVGLRQGAGYGLFVFMGHLLSYSTKVVALVLGCAMLVQGQLTAEQLVSFIFYVEFVTYASLSACDEVVEIMEAVGASERVIGWLEAPPAPQVASGICPTSFGTVELRDVSFRYPTRPNQATLSNINLKLERGQLVALVGASGSGKSTVVALLQRLYDPTAGAVLVDGQDLRTLDAAWYRSQIGVVSQEPRLFGTTIALNIAYGCSATQEEIEDAARQANAHAFIMSLPKGYDTHVTDRLLSGGQKQRIALARALVRKPRLLILDEATSALDSESEAQVQAALDAAMYTRTRSSIVIAHRMSTVQKADWAVVMEAGHIVEQGPHAQLLQLGGIYSRLVLGQAGQEMLAERPEPRPTDGPEPVSSRSREEFLSLDGVDMSDTENELSLGSHAT